MTKAEKLFHQIADKLPNAHEGTMFGVLCIKTVKGKSAAMFWKNSMIFRLQAIDEQKALSLTGASQGTHIYAPDRAMRGWVKVPFSNSARWKALAKKSIAYAMKLSGDKTKPRKKSSSS